jgi:hypothetical protein
MLAVSIRIEGMSLVAHPRLRVMQGPPLSIHSAHPQHTLSSWPTACLRAQRKLCCTDAIFNESKCEFINRFRDFHAPQWLINKLLNVSISNEVSARACNSDVQWLVLGFHPGWERISRAIRCYVADPTMAILWTWAFGKPIHRFAEAWKSQLPAAAAIVQR